MSILVIDDELRILEMISKMLNKEDHKVLVASNGEDGMRIIKSSPEISLVITDIFMPEKEGIETIGELKRDFPHIKILAMSGGGRYKESAQIYLPIAKAFGADSVLYKPFVMQELLESAQMLLDEK